MTNTNEVLPGSTQSAPTAVQQWLDAVAWQQFATFEFSYAASEEAAARKFDQMLNSLERNLRTRVAYVKSTEVRSKSGAVVPRHIHCALTALKPIPSHLVTELWLDSVGRGRLGEKSDLAVVETYKPERGGIAYITKQIGTQHGDWSFKNLHLFAPGIQSEPKQTHAALRAARRWQAQLSLAPLPPVQPWRTQAVRIDDSRQAAGHGVLSEFRGSKLHKPVWIPPSH
jgi:hypothetical protein